VTTPEGGRKYKVLGTIGRGGFGTVYRAELAGEGGFSKVVALKVLNRDVSDIKEVAERMRDEARVLGLVHHRAIVHVDGLLQIDGRWTIVMEWVNGVDLKRVLEEGPIPPGPALEIVTEVASALRAAKEQPGPDGRPLALLHRDLKPSNLHLTPAGEVKVLDFGTARADFASREAKTEMVAFGTLDYMSPERLIFEDVPAGDIYALGAVLYEMLMGEPLGRTNPGPEKHQEIRHAAAQKLAEAGVHEGAVSLIREMIAYEPEDRPTLREVEQRCRDLRVVCGGPWLSDWAADMVPEIRARLADAEDTELAGVVLEEGSSTHHFRDSVDGETQWIRADAPESGEKGGGLDASGPGQAVAARATADPDAPTERAPRRVPMMLLWGLMGGVSFLIVVAIGLGLIFLPRLGGMVVPTEDAVTGEPPAPEEAVVEDGAEPDTAAVAATPEPEPVTPEPEPVVPDPIPVPKPKPVAPRPAPKPSPAEPETAPPPAPTPTPGPAPAPTGTVVVEGDAVKVELVADGKRFPAGKVAPGSYTVEATFTGRGAVQAGSVTVLEGQTVTISCQRAFARCTVR
jgi:serine/threonine-protein kinase